MPRLGGPKREKQISWADSAQRPPDADPRLRGGLSRRNQGFPARLGRLLPVARGASCSLPAPGLILASSARSCGLLGPLPGLLRSSALPRPGRALPAGSPAWASLPPGASPLTRRRREQRQRGMEPGDTRTRLLSGPAPLAPPLAREAPSPAPAQPGIDATGWPPVQPRPFPGTMQPSWSLGLADVPPLPFPPTRASYWLPGWDVTRR